MKDNVFIKQFMYSKAISDICKDLKLRHYQLKRQISKYTWKTQFVNDEIYRENREEKKCWL